MLVDMGVVPGGMSRQHRDDHAAMHAMIDPMSISTHESTSVDWDLGIDASTVDPIAEVMRAAMLCITAFVEVICSLRAPRSIRLHHLPSHWVACQGRSLGLLPKHSRLVRPSTGGGGSCLCDATV